MVNIAVKNKKFARLNVVQYGNVNMKSCENLLRKYCVILDHKYENFLSYFIHLFIYISSISSRLSSIL